MTLAWKVEYTRAARSELRKLDRTVAQRIVDYMRKRVADSGNPRQLGTALSGPFQGLWRYRVGGYRVICDIQDDVMRVLVVRVARRDTAYH